MLRDYQQRAIDDLYAWFIAGNKGNPCIVLPTGAGKSHVVAALCKNALQNWPETRVLMLTHQKELIEQNAEKMRLHWPGAPLGIYSASVGKKQMGEPITFAGIQSLRGKSAEIGHIDLIIIDECHLVNHKDSGGYRTLIAELTAINPALRVVGLTATPYRMGHGLITDAPAIFTDILEPVTIEELVYRGFLAPLRSKPTAAKLSTDGVKKRGGEFIEAELQAAVDIDDLNQQVVNEVISLAGDRRSWLFFCAGVNHAQHICDILNNRGIPTACVTGETPKAERERMLSEFKSGKLRALTNSAVLTTGADFPNLDLIAMLRPTMSPGLYVQMVGRGTRLKAHTDHCLVLDFAGVVETHGPITNVQPPKKGGSGNGEAPSKLCESCNEIVHISAKACPACGHEFPPAPEKRLYLREDDIMGLEGKTMAVKNWTWKAHTSSASGKVMLMVKYYGGLTDKPVSEYLPVLHDGFAGNKARRELSALVRSSCAGVDLAIDPENLDKIAFLLNAAEPPAEIEYRADGKFYRVLDRRWGNAAESKA